MRERRTALLVLTTATLVVGVWATFGPQSFYASFPLGRGWVAADGPYNEHLIRDFGAMNLALSTLTGAAAWRMHAGLVRLAAVVTLVFAIPHFAYHAAHLQPYGTADALANIATLSGQVLVPLWLTISPAPPGSGPARAATAASP